MTNRAKSFKNLMKQSKTNLALKAGQLTEIISYKEKANVAQALLLDEYRKQIKELEQRLLLLNVSGSVCEHVMGEIIIIDDVAYAECKKCGKRY